jgi:hypothetical protein
MVGSSLQAVTNTTDAPHGDVRLVAHGKQACAAVARGERAYLKTEV